MTPPALGAVGKVSLIDASHFDANTAYAADQHAPARRPAAAHLPHARRRQDLDARSSHGLPDGAIVNAVREDPERRGLLFAGTEQAVYVSFDDGDDWQSLRLNMPATSIRDLVIKDDDLVVGTHGRGFWILDDITPLRQLDARLLAGDALSVRSRSTAYARALEHEHRHAAAARRAGGAEPARRRDHRLLAARAGDAGPVTLEILDAHRRARAPLLQRATRPARR